MSTFWDGFEKRAAEKNAGFLTAGFAHLAQNAVMDKLLRSGRFGRAVGSRFTKGLLGQPVNPILQFAESAATGATIPEIGLLRSHARELGNKIREELVAKGIKHISKNDLMAVQHALQGNYQEAAALSPQVATIAAGAVKQSRFFRSIDPKDVAQLANDPNHPLISNIAKNLVQIPKNIADRSIITNAPNLHPKAELAGSAVGSGLLGIVDPVTAGMNAAKYITTHTEGRNLLSRSPRLKSWLDKADEFLVKKPLARAQSKGEQGQSLSKAYQAVNKYVFNPVVASAENTANRLGFLAKKQKAAVPIPPIKPIQPVPAQAAAPIPPIAKAAGAIRR